MDDGGLYLSWHVLNQLRYCGIRHDFGLEPTYPSTQEGDEDLYAGRMANIARGGSRRTVPVPLPSAGGVLVAVVAAFVLPTGAALVEALTAALVAHLWLRSLLFGLAGVGLLAIVLGLRAGSDSLWERWRFWRLRDAVRALRKEIREGQAGGAAQDKLADLVGPLFQLGVFAQEPLPALGNIVHLRTALASLENCMRRWALDEARNTNWTTDYAREDQALTP